MEKIMQASFLDVFGDIMNVSKSLNSDLDALSEEEMVERISDATGLMFIYNDYLERYEARLSKHDKFSVRFDNYAESVKGGARFIGCDYDYHNGGCGQPCDSLDEAIKFFKKELGRMAN